MNIQDPTLNLYNPATQDPEQLLAEFIDRKGLLERILGIIRHNGPTQPQQHVVIIGPRGMGKTTLLCAIKHSIETRDEALNAKWLPILFQEEQYGIGDLADFWLETIRHLEAALHSPAQASEQLLDENPADLAERAQEKFFVMLAETGKRALLLIDNINDIFEAIDDGQSLHSLRALWMTDPRCTVIGAAPSYFEEITEVDQAFHDFFRTFTLDRLSQQELEEFLRNYAQQQGDKRVEALIGQAPERVAALRILTGGNPRLVKLGYRVLRDGLDGDLRKDLERLLDEATPFFKHRIDSLAKETRRVFDAIARRWDPITVDDIRRELRKPSNYVSAQIKRLIGEGFIEEIGGDKKKRYQVSERFYNVYYLMRHSREGRRRLRWLVGFMQTFYTESDFKEWAKRLEGELAGPLAEPIRAEKLAYLHALSAAADGDGRGAVFETIVRDAIARNDRRAIDEDIADSQDPVETHGLYYLLAEIVWLLAPESRRQLGFWPADYSWLQRLRSALGETGLQQAYQCLNELGAWRQDTLHQSLVVAVMLAWLFQKPVEAEAAYRKVLKIDPQIASAWSSLGYMLGNQQRYREAEVAYRKALELDPQDADTWYHLGGSLISQHHYSEAEAAYREALELDPQDVDTWQALGNALSGQQSYSEAETTYRKALELNPQDAATCYNLGNTLADQQRYGEAETAYRKTLELDSQYAAAWNNLGNTLFNQWRCAEAEAAYRRALEFDPQNAVVWSNLGNALAGQERYGEAETAYRKALELDPQYVFTWYGLGSTLSNQQCYSEAEIAYRKALEIDPQHGLAHGNLGGMYLEHMGRIEGGIAELMLGLALEPKNRYGCWVLARHWQEALPKAAVYIFSHNTTEPTLAENLLSVMTETLLYQATTDQKTVVRDALLALEPEAQAIFEPLLLALQALDDRSLLYRIAREKRELVLDVMQRIENKPQ